MKTRTGFVSNSSSSSFIINLADVSTYELKAITEYLDDPTKSDPYPDDWSYKIDYDKNVVEGYTIMDNENISNWLEAHNLSHKVTIIGD